MPQQETEAALGARELKAEALVVGGAFRAAITRDGEVVWRCSHTHFTDHSAKACALRQLEAGNVDRASGQ